MKHTIFGAKRSKGIMRDTGQSYDSTTVYIGFDMKNDENMKGLSVVPLKFGTSDNYSFFDGITLPADFEVEISVTTNGNKLVQEVTSIRPLKPAVALPAKQ